MGFPAATSVLPYFAGMTAMTDMLNTASQGRGNFFGALPKYKKPSGGMTKKRRGKSNVGKKTDARTNKSTSYTKTKKKRKRKTGIVGDLKVLKKKVNELSRDQVVSYYHYRDINPGQVTGTVNLATYHVITLFDKTRIGQMCDDLPFMDRAATPATDTIDPTTQTLENEVHFDSMYAKLRLVNNFEIPATFDIYLCKFKIDTSSTPLATLTSGDADVGITDADTNVLTFPSDFKEFQKTFHIVKHAKFVLKAGDEFVFTHQRKNYRYDRLLANQSGTSYNKGDEHILIRHEGAVAHDTTTSSLVGLGDGGCDYVLKRKAVIRYQGDLNFRKIETVNNLGAISTAEVAGPAIDTTTDGG